MLPRNPFVLLCLEPPVLPISDWAIHSALAFRIPHSNGYQVIARKYRPQRFSDVVGQEHVTQTLARAIEQKRIAHAYLFCGRAALAKPPSRGFLPNVSTARVAQSRFRR